MWCLNKDVLSLIFKELKNDRKSLYSCLLVNRTWCVTAVSILWKNLEQVTNNNSKRILFDVILLHLSEESKDILRNLGIYNLITETYYQRPLFNYINFLKYLDLSLIEEISKKAENSNRSIIISNEILKLFINRDTNFIHLHIPHNFGYQLQLHQIPGVECCFSGLESLSLCCHVNINRSNLEGLARICKSIKKLRFTYDDVDNSGFIKLIKVQKNLIDVSFIDPKYIRINKSFHKSLEESLIKHADTVQYLRMDWNPITRILSYLVNLLSLEINVPNFSINWIIESNYLDNISLPILKILRVRRVPYKILANLIENTKGHLSEISIYLYYHGNDIERLIQAIYQNCPNLKYIKLPFIHFISNANFISEFENLLISCQFLNRLVIDIDDYYDVFRSWVKLFEILTKSSPIGLFKFKITFYMAIKLEHLKLFFNNWKDRNPILLKICTNNYSMSLKEKQQLEDLAKKYEAKGIIKQYSLCIGSNDEICHEDFEWI